MAPDDEKEDHRSRKKRKTARAKIRKADFLQRRTKNPIREHESDTRKQDRNNHEALLVAPTSRKKSAYEFFY